MPETALSPRLEKALAGRGVRVGAQVLNAVPMLLLAGAELFLFYTGKDATGYRVGIVEILLGVCALAVVVMQLVLVLRRAQTIGSSLLRFDYRDPETARPRGGRLFCQLLLTSLLTTVTVGVMAIVLLVTYRRGQSMVDRWLGLVATRPKDIPEEPRPKLNAAPVGRVRQVTMPGMATAAPVSQQPPDRSPRNAAVAPPAGRCHPAARHPVVLGRSWSGLPAARCWSLARRTHAGLAARVPRDLGISRCADRTVTVRPQGRRPHTGHDPSGRIRGGSARFRVATAAYACLLPGDCVGDQDHRPRRDHARQGCGIRGTQALS